MKQIGFLVVFGFLLGAAPAVQTISWPELAKLDYKTGKMPGVLAKKLKSRLKINGYVIPLEGDGKGISSFVLVSDPMFCGHVPPPPPNQLVLVELKRPKPWAFFETGSVSITGNLVVVDQESEFGGHMYQMKKIKRLRKGPGGFESLFR